MTTDLTLYIGGTRSGKSAKAEADALRDQGCVLYVATARQCPGDAAMTERIRVHRARRPSSWYTLECPLDLAANIAWTLDKLDAAHPEPGRVILLDCVTMWVSNMLFDMPDPENPGLFSDICRRETEALLQLMEQRPGRWIAVSGETGLGGIHATALSRNFCDGLGLVNQLLARRARAVWFCVAGKKLLLQD